MRVTFLAACALALSLGAAHAQDVTTPGPEGAEAAVRAYVEAFGRADWEAAARVIDPGELDALTGVVRFLAAMDSTGEAGGLAPDEDLDGASAFVRLMRFVTEMQPGMEEALTSMRLHVLGSVIEGDSLVHVVGRSQTELFGAEISSVQVTSVRWLGDRWAVRLDEQMRGMTDAMTGMMEAFGDDEWDDDEWDDSGEDEDWDEGDTDGDTG